MPPGLLLLTYLEAFLRFLAECGEIPVFREASKDGGMNVPMKQGARLIDLFLEEKMLEM